MYLSKNKILVAGLGNTGLSVLRYCQHINANVAAYDAQMTSAQQQQFHKQFPHIPLFTGDIHHALIDRDTLVLSPGISRRQTAIRKFEQHGGQVIGDIAILSELLRDTKHKIIAITGSNGKTTVTSLVGHLCQQNNLHTIIAGNIGTAVLDAWLNCYEQDTVWVLELSSFQLETTPYLNATAAVCLNISEDHLDRYDNLLDYARSKDMIFNGYGIQILNGDDPLCLAMKRHGRTVRYFSMQTPNDYYFNLHTGELQAQQQHLLNQNQLSLQGTHNATNVLAALALCEAIGLKRENLLNHIQSFKGLSHRVEKIGEKNGITFIDDSKGTNVGATVAAIAGLPEKILLIAGGLGKGQNFTPLCEPLRQKARAVFLIGQDAKTIAQDISDSDIDIVFCDDLPQAVQQAYAIAHKGDIILLSPACSSFDMFQSYAHRAQVFIEAYHNL